MHRSYIGRLPETVCMPCSNLIVAVYRPFTGRIQAVQWLSSGRIQAAADLLISPKCVFNPCKRAWSIAELGHNMSKNILIFIMKSI